MKKPFGLYVHSRFCPQRCPYCAFAVVTGRDYMQDRYIEAVCAECGVLLAAAALQFSLAHPAVTTVIPGCKSVPEAERSIETMVSPRPRGGRCLLHACAHLRRMRCPQNVDIPAGFWTKLKEQKLLPDGVPTP